MTDVNKRNNNEYIKTLSVLLPEKRVSLYDFVKMVWNVLLYALCYILYRRYKIIHLVYHRKKSFDVELCYEKILLTKV